MIILFSSRYSPRFILPELSESIRIVKRFVGDYRRNVRRRVEALRVFRSKDRRQVGANEWPAINNSSSNGAIKRAWKGHTHTRARVQVRTGVHTPPAIACKMTRAITRNTRLRRFRSYENACSITARDDY